MSAINPNAPRVVIACGGTGGHLFPGVAVGGELHRRGLAVTLVVSEKEVDRVALSGETRFEILRLPAAGLGQASRWKVARGLWAAFTQCRRSFAKYPPSAVLAMGGFTAAAPLVAGKWAGAALFLHDSNAVPGRVNRILSRGVQEAFVAFDEAAPRLKCSRITRTGTPVRPEFRSGPSSAASRAALGLDPSRPVLLVTGGSQGARGVNESVVALLGALKQAMPGLQFLHLTGEADFASVQAAYRTAGVEAILRPFLAEMDLALRAATLCVGRAGGSSLAECAALRVPSILIPYPAAADDHQTANARVMAERGAALLLPQSEARAGKLLEPLLRLLHSESERGTMAQQCATWDVPDAADRIATRIVASLKSGAVSGSPVPAAAGRPVG